MKMIVIGLGNPILGDDGVGWRVVEGVQDWLDPGIEVQYLAIGGIRLMEQLVGYDRAILVDAFISNQSPGSITVSSLEDLPDYCSAHMAGPHDSSLQNAMKLGRQLGAKLPKEVIVVGVSAVPAYEFCEELSAPVAGALPLAIQTVLELLA